MAYQVPKDTSLFRYADDPEGVHWLVYDMFGIRVAYKVTKPEDYDLSGLPVNHRQTGSPDNPHFQEFPDAVKGGEAAELDSVAKDFGSWNQFWNHTVTAYLGGNPAKDDPEVLKVMAQVMARPDMGEQELQNLLKQTNYYQARTQMQLEWNDLGAAEKQHRINEQAASLTETYLRTVGASVDYNDPTLRHYAEQIASGKMGAGQVLEAWLRPRALQNPESPWSRTLRNEQENQRTRGVDIENQASAVRQLASKWGVQLADHTLTEWGTRITTKEASEADLEQFLKGQAQILYPWKDPEVATSDAAQPWLQTYSRVLEKGQTDLFNPVIQQALQQGQPLFEFEKSLKMRPEWLETGNAREELFKRAGDMASKMGFS